MKIVRIISGILLASLLGIGAYFGFTYYEQSQKQMIPVLTVSQEIPPRTLITKEMFDQGIIKVSYHPASIVPPNVFRKPEDVIGKYTTTNYTVPQYSYLYQGKVLSVEEIKDGAALQLNPGEKMIAIDVNIKSSLAAQIVEGSYVNLWLVADAKKDNRAVVGPFIDSVRVIGTYSSSTQKVTPTTGVTPKQQQDQRQQNGNQPDMLGVNIVPQAILLAVNNEQAGLIQLAEKLGTIQVVGLSNSQNTSEKETHSQWTTKHTVDWMINEMSETFQVRQ